MVEHNLDLAISIAALVGALALLVAFLAIWWERRRHPWCWQCGTLLPSKGARCIRCGKKP